MDLKDVLLIVLCIIFLIILFYVINIYNLVNDSVNNINKIISEIDKDIPSKKNIINIINDYIKNKLLKKNNSVKENFDRDNVLMQAKMDEKLHNIQGRMNYTKNNKSNYQHPQYGIGRDHDFYKTIDSGRGHDYPYEFRAEKTEPHFVNFDSCAEDYFNSIM